jgi:Fur family ferric uptake transcriptional regulator
VPRELSDIKELLAERDLRLTPQREAILRVLVNHADLHLSADEVFRRTKEECPDIGLATVYRTLEIFENLGIIHKLQFGEEGSRYEFNPEFQKHYHHHLICLSCGGIFEFNEDLLDDIERAISERTGFDVVDHSLRVYGYCRRCRTAARGTGDVADSQNKSS